MIPLSGWQIFENGYTSDHNRRSSEPQSTIDLNAKMLECGYPLRFHPVFRDYLWGGRNLALRLNKPIPESGIWAESWEIVDHPDHDSVVASGRLSGEKLGRLVQQKSVWLLGRHAPQDRFPLLLKYLDCQNVLSVQVHPDDQYARRMTPPDLGKTEAWYIVEAAPDAVIYAGLKSGIDREQLKYAIEQGRTEECLHKIVPTAGDCLFIPAGTVHALGAGLLVAEIQQASNTTFRLFDWKRVGADGKSRPLHVEQALQTIDFSLGPSTLQQAVATDEPGRQRLVSCDKFVLDRIAICAELAIGGDERFHILTVPEGAVTLQFKGGVERLSCGESVLLPAAVGEARVSLESDSTLLDMYLP